MAALEVKNISKKYIVSHEKDTLIRNIMPYIFRREYREEFWALKDINFVLKKGESLGIVGPNGAGKSTLLNILAGIVIPTEGALKLEGRVSSLLTLGAGFHPELTGEENIFLNGSLLGMSLKELKIKLDSIINFSELGSFIDAPIQTYSAGMILRLGFSVAIHVDFDILLVDEILLVGDLYFQEKCFKKMQEFRKEGRMLVISSQSFPLVQSLTDKALLLNRGEVMGYGNPEDIFGQYENLRQNNRNVILEKENVLATIKNKMVKENLQSIKEKWGVKTGTKEAWIKQVNLLNRWGIRKRRFKTGEEVRIEVVFEANKEIISPHFGVAIFKKDYTYCYGPNTMFDGIKIGRLSPGVGRFSIKYPRFLLSGGEYYISVAIWDELEISPYDYHCCCYRLDIRDKENKFLYQEAYLAKITSKADSNGLLVLKDRYGQLKDTYHTEEPLNIEVVFNEDNAPGLIQASVYREDGVPCFNLEKKKIQEKKGACRFELTGLHLLPGRYFISLNGGKDREYFSVYSEKRDHGIVYMFHKWNLKEVGYEKNASLS